MPGTLKLAFSGDEYIKNITSFLELFLRMRQNLIGKPGVIYLNVRLVSASERGPGFQIFPMGKGIPDCHSGIWKSCLPASV